LKSLFRRWPNLSLAVDESEVKWHGRPGMKAIDRLPVMAGAESQRSVAPKADQSALV
jgi:cytochrome P450 PksS